MTYLVFGGEDFYPKGGFEDFLFESDSMEDITERLEKYNELDWFQIVTHIDLKIILECTSSVLPDKNGGKIRTWKKYEHEEA